MRCKSVPASGGGLIPRQTDVAGCIPQAATPSRIHSANHSGAHTPPSPSHALPPSLPTPASLARRAGFLVNAESAAQGLKVTFYSIGYNRWRWRRIPPWFGAEERVVSPRSPLPQNVPRDWRNASFCGIHPGLVVAHNIKDLRRANESLEAFALTGGPMPGGGEDLEEERGFECRRCTRWAWTVADSLAGAHGIRYGGYPLLKRNVCCFNPGGERMMNAHGADSYRAGSHQRGMRGRGGRG